MSFTDIAGATSRAVVPDHNRLRGVEHTATRPTGAPDPHPSKADADHTHPASDIDADAWTTHTPTLTGIAGSVAAAYERVGRSVHYVGEVVASGVVTASILVALPVASNGRVAIGPARAEDASAGYPRTVGLAEINSAVWGEAVHFASTGNGDWSATVPFTWASGDTLTWDITYEAAS